MLPQLVARKLKSAPNQLLQHDREMQERIAEKLMLNQEVFDQEVTRREQWMRRTLRKSIPFVWALLIGTLAGAFVAGVALYAAHS
jgi:hypothetical protein